jgi:hypothetical protein
MSLLVMTILLFLVLLQLRKRNKCECKVAVPEPFVIATVKSSLEPPSPPQLSAVLLFRLFQKDELNFTSEDLYHWLDYMRYAGVEHFYLYDNCQSSEECLTDLTKYPDITYTLWQIADYEQAQTPAYNHHLQTHHPQAMYEILLDMDEYPFMPSNLERNFLRNYALQRQAKQVLFRSIFFGGPPANNTSDDWRVLRYTRRRARAETEGRTKPLYQPKEVNYRDGVHNLHEVMLWKEQVVDLSDFRYSPYDVIMGHHKMEDEHILRINHYWCERLVDGDLVEDDSIGELIQRVMHWKQQGLSQ